MLGVKKDSIIADQIRSYEQEKIGYELDLKEETNPKKIKKLNDKIYNLSVIINNLKAKL
jgi:hypothetical protein